MRIDHVFEEFLSKGGSTVNNETVIPKNFVCLKRLMVEFEKDCGAKMEEYDL